MRESLDDSRFILGVYNYCDRWCERCRLRDRCRVYYDQSRQMAKHLVEDEDPDDPAVVFQDLSEAFAEAGEMLQEMAEEQGIDLDALPPDDLPPVESHRRPDYRHPLNVRALGYTDKIRRLLDRVRDDLPALSHALAGASEPAVTPGPGEESAAERLLAVTEACEVLRWFQLFIAVKCTRVLGSLAQADTLTVPEVAELVREDARGTAKLVVECADRCMAALWTLSELDAPWARDALTLLRELEAIQREVRALVPDYASFCRPGFDEEPDASGG